MPTVTLDGLHYRTLTPDEASELAALHEWWLSQQGDATQAAWGVPASTGEQR